MMIKVKKNIKAFSLIELSIVVLILSIVASASLNLYGRKNTSDKYNETIKRMDDVLDSVAIFYKNNYIQKLPCHAAVLNDRNNSVWGFGGQYYEYDNCTTRTQSTHVASNVIAGQVPTGSLSLPAHYASDAWGSKLAYIIEEIINI